MNLIKADPLTMRNRMLKYQAMAKLCLETISAPVTEQKRDIANDSLKFWLANIARTKKELSECQLQSVLTIR